MKKYQVCRECHIRWVQHDRLCARCAKSLGLSQTGQKTGRPRKWPTLPLGSPAPMFCVVLDESSVYRARRAVRDEGVEFEVVWP